jgi:cyclohexadienyl dehydratase
MLRTAFVLFLIGVLCACTSTSSPAQLRQARVIRFGLTADYPPFAYRTADGHLAGADVVIAERVAAMLGGRAVFVDTTWQTLASDFSARRFDIAIGGLSVTPDRKALGLFSRTLLVDGKRPLARCGEKARYGTVEQIDRPGVTVMITTGPGIAALAQQWFSHATLVTEARLDAYIPALLNRSVDVWVTDGVVIDQMARRYPGQLCATTTMPFNSVNKAWLIRRDQRLVAQVNTALEKLLREGVWQTELVRVR